MIRTTQQPPGPGRLRLLSDLPGMVLDPLGFLIETSRRYGGVSTLFPDLRRFYLVTHPAAVKQVLQDNAREYKKADLTITKFAPFTGNSVVTSEGAVWQRQRRIVQPAFHRERLEGLYPFMVTATQAMLTRWQERRDSTRSIDLVEEFKRLALNIISSTMFGQDISERTSDLAVAMHTAQEYVTRQMTSLFGISDYVLFAQRRAARQAAELLNRTALELIEQRKQKPEGPKDLLSILLAARDPETGESLNEEQLRDEVKGIMIAGYESTSTVMSWAVYLLSRHPAAQEKLAAEVRDVLGDRTPTLQDLPRLVYAKMVFEETMRLYPPVWLVLRTPLVDTTLGGYGIPKDSVVLLSPFLTQRHPEIWPDPDAFDPERFAPERASSRPRYAYFPFGGGPRACLGGQFATMEAQLILAMLAQRVRIEPLPGQVLQPRALLTLQPDRGFLVRVHHNAPT